MSLFNELKRRNVLRVGAAYIVAAWLVIQVTETIFPLFGFDDTPARLVVIVLSIAFIPSLIFAWVFEITPEGLKRDEDVVREHSIAHVTGKKLDRIILVVLALALGYFAFDKFVLSESREAAIAETAHQAGRNEALVESYGDKSIAVLPFVNMSSDPEQEYFSDGISEELLNLLSKIPEMRVISRSSAFSYKDRDLDIPTIAAQLNVAHILEGSVRKTGNQVRITAQLIEARSDTHLWSETYDRELENIFDVQDEIAAIVVEKLKITLLGGPPKTQKTKPEVYTLNLQADYLAHTITEESLREAIVLYKEALAIDPAYVPAWLGISATYNRLGGIRVMSAEQARTLSLEAIRHALAIAPDSAKALDGMAWISFKNDGDYVMAAENFERALIIEPTNTHIIGNVSIFLTSLGRLGEAIQFAEYQVSRDPVNVVAYNNLGIRYRFAEKFEKAKKTFSTTLLLNPTAVGVEYEIGAALLSEGNFAAAAAAFEREPFVVFQQIGMAMTCHAQGMSDLSDELLEKLISSFGDRIPYYIAQIMAFRGEFDGAFEWLERAHLGNDYEIGNIIHEPLLKGLRTDPRWLPFLERIGKAPEQLDAIKFKVTLPE